MAGLKPGHLKEKVVLRQCREYLAALGWRVVRNQQGLGCEKGISDLTAVTKPRGVILAVETKSTTGRPSKEQVAYLDSIIAAGGEGLVVNSVDALHLGIQRICDRRDDITRPRVSFTGKLFE